MVNDREGEFLSVGGSRGNRDGLERSGGQHIYAYSTFYSHK